MKFTMKAFACATLVLGMMSAQAATEGSQTDLELAYEKEYAFLDAQKNALTKRLTEMDIKSRQEEKQARRDIEALQDKVLKVDSRAETLAELLVEAERVATSTDDNNVILDATLSQAGVTLEPYGIKIEGDEAYQGLNNAEKLAKLFGDVEKVNQELASVRKTDGFFFLEDGSKASGTIIKVGNVASYGISDKASGALAPAGDGNLKLWTQDDSAAVAQALAAGEKPASLKMFIYENLNTEFKADTEKTMMDTLRAGGIIGWIIVALGIIALVLTGLRVKFLNDAHSDQEELSKMIDNSVANRDLDGALSILKQHKGSASRVLAATIRNLDRDRDHVEDIVTESILNESNTLDRFGTAIIVAAAVAPLLGLLGTVTGMIATFDVITEYGTGDPKMLSGGISEALVTTELGLIVAIPALLIGNLLSGWAERIKSSMEQSALRVINIYAKAKG